MAYRGIDIEKLESDISRGYMRGPERGLENTLDLLLAAIGELQKDLTAAYGRIEALESPERFERGNL